MDLARSVVTTRDEEIEQLRQIIVKQAYENKFNQYVGDVVRRALTFKQSHIELHATQLLALDNKL
jgi:hypothetical protein